MLCDLFAKHRWLANEYVTFCAHVAGELLAQMVTIGEDLGHTHNASRDDQDGFCGFRRPRRGAIRVSV